MKINCSVLLLILCSLVLFAGGEHEAAVDAAGWGITVEPGDHFRHPFPLFLGIRLKNPPQMALWAESLDGEFLGTVMVTEKTARRKWAKAPQDPTPGGEIRRPEALPVWSHRQGGADTVPDAVTQATPKGDFSVQDVEISGDGPFYLYFEVNHSTDFNAAYPADAQAGDDNYSGGEWGSGQPALVYRLLVDPSLPPSGEPRFELIGRSSASGADGGVYGDLTGIDSALDIVAAVRLTHLR